MSASNVHTVNSTINNISRDEPRQRRSQPYTSNRITRNNPTSVTPQTPKDSEYVAIRISKLDLYLLFTLLCSILVTTCAIIYDFNVGFVIVATIVLFLTIERSKAKLCSILNGLHAVVEHYIVPEAERNTWLLTHTPHFIKSAANHNPLLPHQIGSTHRSSPKIGRNRSIKIHAYTPGNAPRKGETVAKLIEDQPYVQGIVAGCYETDMLVDYGASTSVISRSVIEEIEKKLETTLPRLYNDVHIRSYGGHSVPSEGTVMMPVTIGKHTFKTPFTITPCETATKVILGLSLIHI